MKFTSIVCLTLALTACESAPVPATSNPGSVAARTAVDGGEGQRLVALVDYVAADYGGAVHEGRVVSPFEYDEQKGFIEAARSLAPQAATSDADRQAIARRLDALRGAVLARSDAATVASLGREARQEIVARLNLTTTPLRPPVLRNGEVLFAQSCATCHGADGAGMTEIAAALDPKPRDFRLPERREAMSPYRVYNTLTLGIPGTAMPAFDSLSSSDRWDLAFYVMRLGHAAEAAKGPVSMTLADLASRSDADVLAALTAEGHPDPRAGVAFARREAAFANTTLGIGIEQTRSLVRRATGLGVAGRTGEADRAALDAYLQGFEPLEAQISARDPNRTQSVEIAFRDFRGALATGNGAAIESQARVLDELISRAESRTGATLPFVAAFIIYFREGVEAALLVGALLGGVRKLGRADGVRAIHAGWISALAAGLATWILLSRFIAIPAAQRELAEAALGLAAALVLFSVSFWMISKAESRKWTAFLKAQLDRGLGSGRTGSLAALAFVAVYRECAETILFTEALLIESAGRWLPVFAGALAGLVGVGIIALAVQTAVRRLPMPVFFGVSGVLLSLLAVAFAGSGVSSFVAAGYLQPRPIAFPSIPSLGIHPDLSSLLVQAALMTVLLFGGLRTILDARSQPEAGRKS